MEKYKPGPREIKKAEESMSHMQATVSEAREEGYNLAMSKNKEAQKKENGPDKSYHERVTVNNVQISVGWDGSYNDYTLIFPQIEVDWDDPRKKGVTESALRISPKPEKAKQVFDLASKLAQTESDVYEIYRQIYKFCLDEIYGTDE